MHAHTSTYTHTHVETTVTFLAKEPIKSSVLEPLRIPERMSELEIILQVTL